MARWMRVEHEGAVRFGTVCEDRIAVHTGDMFADPQPSGRSIALGDVRVLTPVVPSKMIALANNSGPALAKSGAPVPEEPLYLLKANSSFQAHAQCIRRPAAYDGKVIFEGELGLVIGKVCRQVSEAQAYDYLFGCTCINDVTAIGILNKDPSFAQWTRCKAADTFGVFGPVVASGVDPDSLRVTATLDGVERQNYPVSDLVFSPAQLISRLSHDMSLLPGDIIACGTSVGVGSMKPGSHIEIHIDGIGSLQNVFE